MAELARLAEVERRLNVHDEEIKDLSTKVAEFVGEAKGTNKILALIVGLSAVAQFFIQLWSHRQ